MFTTILGIQGNHRVRKQYAPAEVDIGERAALTGGTHNTGAGGGTPVEKRSATHTYTPVYMHTQHSDITNISTKCYWSPLVKFINGRTCETGLQ